jgi:vacuolar-type H+-ATPase subunit F/Vma7
MTATTARVQIVAPGEIAVGFRLAGAAVHVPDDAVGAAATVRALVDGGERGVIAVYEPWFDALEPAERERLEASVAPVVVPVPSGLVAAGGAARRARLAGLLQRAVGYHITFEEGE